MWGGSVFDFGCYLSKEDTNTFLLLFSAVTVAWWGDLCVGKHLWEHAGVGEPGA